MQTQQILNDGGGRGGGGGGSSKVILMRAPQKPLKITTEDYTSRYWPTISHAVSQILSPSTSPTSSSSSSSVSGIPSPSASIATSQEELYRTVYHVCCQRHTVTLYNDLIHLVTDYLQQIHSTIRELPDNQLLTYLNHIAAHFKKAAGIICTIFRYLDKSFVVEKLQLSLNTVLSNHFNTIVFSRPEIKEKLSFLLTHLPSDSDPSVLMNVVKTLFQLDPTYTLLNPKLFSLYIPGLEPARSIEQEVQATLDYIAYLSSIDFSRKCSVLKRKYAEFCSS